MSGSLQPKARDPSRSAGDGIDGDTLRAAAQLVRRGAWARAVHRTGLNAAPGAARILGILSVLSCLATGGVVSLPGPHGMFRGGTMIVGSVGRQRGHTAPLSPSGMEIDAMRAMRLKVLVAGLAVGVAGAASAQTAVEWRIADGGNGHFYAVIGSTQSWNAARASAEAMGGTLAGFQSNAERLWCIQQAVNATAVWREITINGVKKQLGPWVGGYQQPGAAEPAGGWFWTEGGPVDLTGPGYGLNNWNCGSGVNEDRLCLFSDSQTPSAASVIVNDLPERGFCESGWTNPGFMVEWSADCNGDGLVDYGQIQAGDLEDSNSNNIPDCCEVSGSCPVNLAVNGGFEAGTPLNICTGELVASGSAIGSGWMVHAGVVQRARASASCATQGVPRFGEFFVDLLESGEIRQTVATTPGRSYRLTFWISGDCAGGLGTKRVTAALGSSAATFDHVCTGAGSQTWRACSVDFIANATVTMLSLKSAAGGTANGPLVDGVRVEDVSISCPGDVDGDGQVGGGDVGLVLLNFGDCPTN